MSRVEQPVCAAVLNRPKGSRKHLVHTVKLRDDGRGRPIASAAQATDAIVAELLHASKPEAIHPLLRGDDTLPDHIASKDNVAPITAREQS
jgi:hypothetical protein